MKFIKKNFNHYKEEGGKEKVGMERGKEYDREIEVEIVSINEMSIRETKEGITRGCCQEGGKGE